MPGKPKKKKVMEKAKKIASDYTKGLRKPKKKKKKKRSKGY